MHGYPTGTGELTGSEVGADGLINVGLGDGTEDGKLLGSAALVEGLLSDAKAKLELLFWVPGALAGTVAPRAAFFIADWALSTRGLETLDVLELLDRVPDVWLG